MEFSRMSEMHLPRSLTLAVKVQIARVGGA